MDRASPIAADADHRAGAEISTPHDYPVSVRPLSEEDGGGFVALVPALPGCMSDGETPQDALTNAYDAIVCWIEAALEAGRTVPEPRVYA